MLRKTGYCNECAKKRGIGLIQDLLKTDLEQDSDQLLALSALIGIEARTSKLSDDRKQFFATVFRDIAFRIENESDTRQSLWDTFWRMKPHVKNKEEDLV